MSLSERFTDRARAVLKMAKDVAITLNATNIDTHHILMAMWREHSGVAVNALLNLGVDDNKFKKVLQSIVKGDQTSKSDQVYFTEEAKRLLAQADEQARKLEHKMIGTEHLLLAMAASEGSKAHKVLVDCKLSFDKIKNEIIRLLGEVEFEGAEATYKDSPDKEVKTHRRRRSSKETPMIEKFCIDLTALAEQSKLDPTIGRQREIRRVMQILGRKTKNNPVLIGEAGVGKTKLVEGIAQAIISGDVPEDLKDKRLCAVDLAAMVAGTKYRGQFEERIKGLLKEVIDCGDTILFIDELHTMVGAGGSEGGMDASNIMKPALSRGTLRCIGTTTLDEYRKRIEKDGALSRRFQPVLVDPTSRNETIRILEGLRGNYEAHHGVKYTHPALEAAVELSERYISDRFLPDKAIDVIDEAGSSVKMDATFSKPDDINKQEEEIALKTQEKDEAVRNQEFEKAAQLRDIISKLKIGVEKAEEDWKEKLRTGGLIIDENVIAYIVAGMTGIPVTQVTEEETSRLLNMEDELHKSVISQHDAISKVAEAIRRSRSGINDPKKPMASFLFVGPTGVGKTLLCKKLASFLFGTEEALIQLDMSEYQEKHNVSRLMGAPPGYIGYEEGGQLTERVRRKPYSIVLFDEIEKAHPDIFNTLLQIMEEGKLTDSFGRAVNFRNTIIVMTSNVGSDLLRSSTGLGFIQNTEDASFEQMQKTLEEAIEKTFRPEFINRLDEIVAFRRLTKKDVGDIFEIETFYLRQRLENQGLGLVFTEDAKQFLINEGYSEIFGARPLKRAIRKYVENPLSKAILEGRFKESKTITITAGDNDVCFEGDKMEDALGHSTIEDV